MSDEVETILSEGIGGENVEDDELKQELESLLTTAESEGATPGMGDSLATKLAQLKLAAPPGAHAEATSQATVAHKDGDQHTEICGSHTTKHHDRLPQLA